MAVSPLSAARTLCELREWNVTNLELQKLLYIAQMIHLGEHHTPLQTELFEAWDYGPVLPSVYRQAKGFGREPVRNVFHWVTPVGPESSEYAAIQTAISSTRGFTPGQLVAVTHWPDGAWANVYKPGRLGLTIPNRLIEDEYDERKATRLNVTSLTCLRSTSEAQQKTTRLRPLKLD